MCYTAWKLSLSPQFEAWHYTVVCSWRGSTKQNQQSVKSVTPSCSEMELKTHQTQATFCETGDWPHMVHVASWAVSLRLCMSPWEYWMAGQVSSCKPWACSLGTKLGQHSLPEPVVVYPNRARQGGTWSREGVAMLQDPLPSPLREDAAKWLGFRLAVSLKSRILNNETV